jgi:ribosomal protein L29
MPLPKAKDFREKTNDELAKDLENFGKEIATLPDTKYGRKQSLKKLVARILTVMNERKRAEQAKAETKPAQKSPAKPPKAPEPKKQAPKAEKKAKK